MYTFVTACPSIAISVQQASETTEMMRFLVMRSLYSSDLSRIIITDVHSTL